MCAEDGGFPIFVFQAYNMVDILCKGSLVGKIDEKVLGGLQGGFLVQLQLYRLHLTQLEHISEQDEAGIPN